MGMVRLVCWNNVRLKRNGNRINDSIDYTIQCLSQEMVRLRNLLLATLLVASERCLLVKEPRPSQRSEDRGARTILQESSQAVDGNKRNKSQGPTGIARRTGRDEEGLMKARSLAFEPFRKRFNNYKREVERERE